MPLRTLRAKASALFVTLFLSLATCVSCADVTPRPAPLKLHNRIASLFLSQGLINELLTSYVKSDVARHLEVQLDPDKERIFLRGDIQVPVDELHALNLDKSLWRYRFQLAIKPEITSDGHLILVFPLSETFFYPSVSKDPERDRIIVPVQLLSVALASVRGYLAALSGDFSSFDRRTEKLTALLHDLDREIQREKNSDAREQLVVQRDSYKLQLAEVPIERKQFEALSKQITKFLGFTGEKDLNINDELGAERNALILKIRISQIAPYLAGMKLGGVRLLHDKIDGGNETFLAVDVASDLSYTGSTPVQPKAQKRNASRKAPSLAILLSQSLFASKAVLDAEKKHLSSKIKNLTFNLQEDGLHVDGAARAFLFFTVHFHTIVDLVTTDTDTFQIRIRDFSVAGINMGFLRQRILDTIKSRLDTVMKGICTFRSIGEQADESQALEVKVDPAKLIPAFPKLHLVGVDIRNGIFLLKIGKA